MPEWPYEQSNKRESDPRRQRGDCAGSCWGAASVNWVCRKAGHGEGGGEDTADWYCMLWCE